MTATRFIAMHTDIADAFRAGRLDANGQPPEHVRSDGSGLPCRHCLADIAAGEPALLFAWRPFDTSQPYAETGPVFLHADACVRHREDGGLPPVLRNRERAMVRGYDAAERIVYGSGESLATARLPQRCLDLLAGPRVVSVHLRSATNGCYLCRVEPAASG